jgi:DUF971 family protein
MIDPPSNLRALQSEQILEVVWNDGRIDRLPYRKLRAECPCATCRDEWTGERILKPETIPPDLSLSGMSPVGTYAVQLSWSDGHSSGLYTWDSLRQFGEQFRD